MARFLSEVTYHQRSVHRSVYEYKATSCRWWNIP